MYVKGEGLIKQAVCVVYLPSPVLVGCAYIPLPLRGEPGGLKNSKVKGTTNRAIKCRKGTSVVIKCGWERLSSERDAWSPLLSQRVVGERRAVASCLPSNLLLSASCRVFLRPVRGFFLPILLINLRDGS